MVFPLPSCVSWKDPNWMIWERTTPFAWGHLGRPSFNGLVQVAEEGLPLRLLGFGGSCVGKWHAFYQRHTGSGKNNAFWGALFGVAYRANGLQPGLTCILSLLFGSRWVSWASHRDLYFFLQRTWVENWMYQGHRLKAWKKVDSGELLFLCACTIPSAIRATGQFSLQNTEQMYFGYSILLVWKV